MKKLALMTALLLFVSFTGSFAQTLQAYIGTGDRSEVALDVKGLDDGGSVIVGYTTQQDKDGPYNYTTTDMMMVRLDANGNVVWNRTYGLPDVDDRLVKVILSSQGDFVAVGNVGMVPAQFPWVGPMSVATIMRINPANGNITAAFLQAPTGVERPRGEIYHDVAEMEDGNLCAVGTRDYRDDYADGMVTMWDASLGIVWHRNWRIEGTSELVAVTTPGDRLHVLGHHMGPKDMDLHIVELDPSDGSYIWGMYYDYTAVFGEGKELASNLAIEMEVLPEEKELRVLTQATRLVGNPPTMSGILAVDMNNGAVVNMGMYNDPAYQWANVSAMHHEAADQAYYLVNPSDVEVNQQYPNLFMGSVSDALTSVVDPQAVSITDARYLLHNGTQSLNSVNLAGSDRHFAGSSVDDEGHQLGLYDIYYVKSYNWLPEGMEGCKVEDPKMRAEPIEVKYKDFKYEEDDKHETPEIKLRETEERYKTRLLCHKDPPPCDILDISYCSKLSTPGTFTFNVTTNPGVSNVEWNFGDGSAPVSASSAVAVSHTYLNPGNYTVCVKMYNPAGDLCDEQCINICVNLTPPPAPSQKKEAPEQGRMNDAQEFEVGDIYPNPTDGSLNIPLRNTTAGMVTVRVMGMNGTVVFNQELSVNAGQDVLKLNVSNFVPGNYIFEIVSGNEKTTKMVTKH